MHEGYSLGGRVGVWVELGMAAQNVHWDGQNCFGFDVWIGNEDLC
jgi:hypothetical protein